MNDDTYYVIDTDDLYRGLALRSPYNSNDIFRRVKYLLIVHKDYVQPMWF